MDIYHYLELLLVPITNVVTWAAATRKRRNDAVNALQETVDMLVCKNNTIYKELIDTRKELAAATMKIGTLESNQEKLLLENSELKKLIEEKGK